jgi:hypothetical protein
MLEICSLMKSFRHLTQKNHSHSFSLIQQLKKIDEGQAREHFPAVKQIVELFIKWSTFSDDRIIKMNAVEILNTYESVSSSLVNRC